MENFCYWQEDTPQTNIELYELKRQKICLLRLNEYKIQKELELTKYGPKISIFCPYNKEDALQCIDYLLIKDIE